MKNHFLKILATALALLLHLPAHAEDVDLFVGIPPSTTDVPNVLIIMDNTGNWTSPFAVEKTALVSVLNSLTENKFRVGLMLFTETGGSDSGNDGSYLRAAVRLMDAGTKAKYSALVNSLDVVADKSNSGKIGKALEEAYLYYKGQAPYAGNNKAKTDYIGNTAGTAASTAVYALAGNAMTSKAATVYNSPVLTGSCSRNYIIYISNGAAQDSTADVTQATNALAVAGGDTSAIPLNPSGSQDNPADEWARFMKISSVGITVYTIDINKVTTGQGPGWTALLKSVAGQSGGDYFDVSSGVGTQIQDALNDIFSKIQSVNSVFASVSLPVSVNTQGTYLNQVYVGMFRPDADQNPRWAGNLKQYKLGKISGDLKLEDANSAAAINNQTGFISECARSFWTPSVLDSEWSSHPSGDCLTVANSRVSNYPDGNVVEKGAQAYQLRASSTRTAKTCSATSAAACSSGGLLAFDNTNVTATMLNAADAAERDAIINWSIGMDNKEDENINGVWTDRRLSDHGDVVHSRPVAVNFGGTGSTNVVVFYGGNDGFLRAVNGNRSNAIGSIPAGGEFWSFMPPEFYSSIKRLRDNRIRISFPGNAFGTPVPQPKNYGMDGPITAFQGPLVAGGATKTFAYGTMRRGGRAVYAFDVTNSLTAPSSPTLKWKIGCAPDGTGCTSGMDGIGQTWSSLKAFTTDGVGSGVTPLIIMGGGYDTCEDYDALVAGGMNNNCAAASKGHYVYVLDADTGAVVKAFNTGENRGIIADITLVRDGNNQVIYGYTADLGGNVYRLTFTGAAADWTITKIAALGCDGNGSCATGAPNRKFMFAPSIIATDGVPTLNSTYVVLLGSGDREKPLNYYAASSSVRNKFFMFSDKPSVAPATYPGAGDCGTTIICMNSLFAITTSATPTAAELGTKKGWSLALAATEQVVTSAITVFGVVTFSTHQPAVLTPGSCSSNLGTTQVYNIAYTNAGSANGTVNRFEHVAGDGLPPSPVAGMVTLDNGEVVPFLFGGSAGSALESELPKPLNAVIQPKGRLYWYIQK
jgi:type IV pilus assembly protein PilY1